MITKQQLQELRDSCSPFDTAERHLMQQCNLALLGDPRAIEQCEAAWRKRSTRKAGEP